MIQFKTKLLACIFIAPSFMLTACAGSSSSSGGGGGATVAAAATDLQGSWANACQDAGSTSSQTVLNFSGTSVTIEGYGYTSSNCTGATFVTINYPGTYTTAGASSVSGATNIDVTFPSTLQVTITSASAVAALNQQAYCGITTWAVNIPQSLSTTNSCLGGSLNVLSANDIYEVSGNSLYFGNSGDTALSTSAADSYTRQ